MEIHSFSSREEWLQDRSKGIGGSEIATLLGANPYETPKELYLYKKGLKKKEFSEAAQARIDAGHRLEPKILKQFQEKYKLDYVLHVDNVTLVNPKCNILRASIDGLLIEDQKPEVLLECKAISKNGIRLWKEGVPKYYYAQVQFYMHVLEIPKCYVLALFDEKELNVYPIKYSEGYGKLIEKVAKDFWFNYFLKDIEPLI